MAGNTTSAGGSILSEYSLLQNSTDAAKVYNRAFIIISFYQFFFSPGATTPIGGCILQPSSGL